MSSVIRGNDITLEAHYHLNGVLIDPAFPRVTVRNSLGVAVVLDATPDNIAVGIFQYTYPVLLTDELGIWAFEWQGVIAGQSVGPIAEQFEVLPIGAIAPSPSASYSYNLATAVGQVRLLIDDRDMSSVSTALPLEQRSAIFTDEEIQQFLTDQGDSTYLAAAIALTTIAGNRQLLVMSRRIGKTEVNYGPVRKDLLDQAKQLRGLADLTAGGLNAPADGIAEQFLTDFAGRQIIENRWMRENQ